MATNGKKPTPPSQRDISISAQQPYNPPSGAPGFAYEGNPSNAQPNLQDRSNQISFKGDTVKPFTLGIQDIDEAVIYYIENIIKPTVIQNGVVQKVPIVYGSAERWKQIQKSGFLKDVEGKTMLPFITFKRDSIEKNRTITNKLDSNFPNNYYVFTKTYNKKDVYDKFSILNNRKPTKEYYVVVVPDYVTVTYSFVVGTYYIEQMNKIVEAMNYASDSYWGNPERFKFKANIDSFSHAVEIVSANERSIRSTFSLKLNGYIVPDNIQKQLISLKKFSERNQVVFNTEIVSDVNNIPNINNLPNPRLDAYEGGSVDEIEF